uniref:Vesicle transport v-SNARE 13 n=1 Tax=Arundo donax TaxID=35708 RepID=A0A0A9EBF2_ARUDO
MPPSQISSPDQLRRCPVRVGNGRSFLRRLERRRLILLPSFPLA